MPQRIVLCVDDDPDDQLLMLETIRDLDPTIRVASALNGREALRFLEESKADGAIMPCLVIMDINMPVMDGKKAVMEIRKHEAYNNVPVVLFTTSSSPLDQLFARQQNVPFLTKSNNIGEFREVVKKLLTTVANC